MGQQTVVQPVLETGILFHKLGILSEIKYHMTNCSKYQVVNDLCQPVGQPREENFKLGIKDQAGEIGMTHTQLKRL